MVMVDKISHGKWRETAGPVQDVPGQSGVRCALPIALLLCVLRICNSLMKLSAVTSEHVVL